MDIVKTQACCELGGGGYDGPFFLGAFHLFIYRVFHLFFCEFL